MIFCMTFSQIGASEHAAEIHWVHVKEGTDDDLLVVGVLFDTSGYGSNVEVSEHLSFGQKIPCGQKMLVIAPQPWQTGSLGAA